MKKNAIVVITDLHIGRGNDSEVYSKALLDFTDFFVENCPKECHTLVINGDTTNGYVVTPKMMKTFSEFAVKIQNKFETVIFNLGNHDIRGRKSTIENSIDILTGFGATKIFGEYTSIEIVRVPTEFVSPFEFKVFPYRTYTENFDIDFIEPVCFFTHENNPHDTEGIPVLNGHIHERGKLGNVINLGVCYQLDADQDIRNLGFSVVRPDGSVEHISYPQKPLFIRIAMNDNKIDGENAIKWISANREDLKSCHSITIKVDHSTSKSILEKFKGVLSTINSKFEVIDEVKFVVDVNTTSESRNFLQTMKTLVPKETHTKLDEIYQEALK